MAQKKASQQDYMQIPAKDFVLPSGTAFPTTPAPVEGQKFYRTDLDVEYVCTNPTGPVWSALSTGTVPDASATVKGIVELATDAEALTGTDTVRAVTPANLQAKINALVAAAPGLLDTLDELAAALGDDPNFAATMTAALAAKQPLDATLTALAGLATGANKLAYSSGTDTFAQTDLTAFGRSLIGFTSLTSLALGIAGHPIMFQANCPALTAGVWNTVDTGQSSSLQVREVSFFESSTQSEIDVEWRWDNTGPVELQVFEMRPDKAFSSGDLYYVATFFYQ